MNKRVLVIDEDLDTLRLISIKIWLRRQNIAAKHNREISVNPFSGEKLTGAGHAPLLYAKDPRSDVPADLGRHLKKQIKGKDDVIVSGWLD